MVDGLSSELGEIGSPSIVNLGVANEDLAANSVSGTAVSPEYGPVAIGSPSAFGNTVQAQEFVSSAGSIAVVQFGNAFLAAPTVVVHAVGGLADVLVAAGSVVIDTTAATASGSVIATGSGRI